MVTGINVKILKDARDRIEDPNRWCRMVVAVNSEGVATYAEDLAAVKWCAWGSIVRSIDDLCKTPIVARPYIRYLSDVSAELGYVGNIIDLNDSTNHSHGPVIKVFNRAIEKLEKEDGDEP